MALLSSYARRRKLQYFFDFVPKDARILDVGCADGWVGEYAVANGWTRYVGIDVAPVPQPCGFEFVRGDVNRWPELGLEPASFDVIVAFEVIEHGDYFEALHDLLRPGGHLLVTTPVPGMDWACRLLEGLGLNQRRTSPHTHLIRLTDLPDYFVPVATSVRGGMSQWGVFTRSSAPDTAGKHRR